MIGSHRYRRWTFVLPALLAVLAYFSAVRGDFVLDDATYVVRNASVVGDAGIFDSATPPERPDLGLYRPLTVLTYRWQYERWGLDPVPFRAANVALHAAVSSALVPAALAVGATPPIALLAACLFAVHPIHVEAVAWIVGRAEVLAALFALLALIARSRRTEFDACRTALAAGLLGFAALAKESAFPFAAVLVLADVLARLPRRVITLRAACYALVLTVVIVARVSVLGRFGPEVESNTILGGMTALERGELALRILGFSLRALLVPDALSIWYEPRRFGGPLLLVLGLVVAIGSLAMVWRAHAARNAGIAAGFGWFAVSMTPFLHLIPIAWVFGDRFLYLASAGFILGCVATLARLPLPRPAQVALAAIALVSYLGATIARVPVFSDDRTLWEDAVAKDPSSGFCQARLGEVLAERGRFDFRADDDRGAILHWQESLQVEPDHPFAARTHAKLADYYAFAAHDVDRALGDYRAALKIDPQARDPAVLEAAIRLAGLPNTPTEEAVTALEVAARAASTPELRAAVREQATFVLSRKDLSENARTRLTALATAK